MLLIIAMGCLCLQSALNACDIKVGYSCHVLAVMPVVSRWPIAIQWVHAYFVWVPNTAYYIIIPILQYTHTHTCTLYFTPPPLTQWSITELSSQDKLGQPSYRLVLLSNDISTLMRSGTL